MAGNRYGDKLRNNVEFLLFDKGEAGKGTPYGLDKNSPTSLLNVAAAGMSIDGDNPLDFVLWLKELELKGELTQRLGEASELGLCPASARTSGYYPRVLYGQYTRQRLEECMARAKAVGIKVTLHDHTEVVGVDNSERAGQRVHFKQSGVTEERHEDVSHVFYTTGHHSEEQKTKYKKSKRAINFPASREDIESVINPTPDAERKVAVIGSSLSGVDAIFSVLLHPNVGKLVWDGNNPSYHHLNKKISVDCYSRRGYFSKVRPDSNLDIELDQLGLPNIEKLRNAGQITLDTVKQAIEQDMNAQLAMKARGKLPPDFNIDTIKKAVVDPFKYLEEDVQWAEDGDPSNLNGYVRWYQVMHSMFPALQVIYRNLSTADRLAFNRDYGSFFLWAFAPMPVRSAKVLLAMRKAGALTMSRIGADGVSDDEGGFTVASLSTKDVTESKRYTHLCSAEGLASQFSLDVSDLTHTSSKSGDFVFVDPYAKDRVAAGKDTSSAWIADDGTFELAELKDGELRRGPARRGVGYFLRNQMYDIQAVPGCVKYCNQVAELYYDEFIHRLGESVV